MNKGKTKKPRLRAVIGLNGHFEPCSDYDYERIVTNYTVGSEVEIEVFQCRSLPLMRLYWACLHHTFHNDRFGYASPEKINDALLIDAGVCTPERRLDGTIVMVPDSIAFRNMDESTFKRYFDKAKLLIWTHWQIDIDTLLREGQRLLTTKRQIKPYQTGDNHGRSEAPSSRDQQDQGEGPETAEAA